jgi:beta-phosphoglucomutase
MGQPFDAVLFDFDGVLVDSEPIHHWAWRAVLARYGAALSWDAYAQRCIGKSLPSIVQGLSEISAGSISVEALFDEYAAKAAAYRTRMP